MAGKIADLEDDDSSVEDLPTSPARHPQYQPDVPTLFTSLPPIKDPLVTDTSRRQDQVIEECLPFLEGKADPTKTIFDFSAQGVARLEHEDHVAFLIDSLHHARFQAYDPSRPWVVYWSLTGLSLLAQDVSVYRQRYAIPRLKHLHNGGNFLTLKTIAWHRVIETFAPAQNATGGFGGGHGQISHCAPSYAVVLSLAIVGGVDAWDLIDRRALWAMPEFETGLRTDTCMQMALVG